MAFVTTIGPFLDAYRANLILRSGLSDVNVFTAWVNNEEAGLKSIVFGKVAPTEDWGLIGNRRLFESYTIEGQIWTELPGAGEAVISAVRTQSEAILSEMIEELRTNGSQGISSVRNSSRVSSWEETSGISSSDNRMCQIKVIITVEADVTG